MPTIIPQSYYLDAPSLGAASRIYLDQSLEICANDGYYSDGIITRQLVDCVLLPQQICPTCGIPCGTENISASGGQGVYQLNIDTGTGTGAILIKFEPFGVPDGIKAILDSVVYNKLSSPLDGYHQSTGSANFTFVGDIADDCGLAGSIYPTLTNYLYDGTVFVNQGTTQTVVVAAGDVSLSSTSPGECLMVIPKTVSTPFILNVIVCGACSGTAFDINISCPALLPQFDSSYGAVTSEDACQLELLSTNYFASLSNSANIDIFDYVFSDANGQFALGDGFYNIDNNGTPQWMEVENGIVIALGSCVPSCPNQRVVFQICNSNAITDDNFDIFLNGVYIGAVDLSANAQVGSVFIGDLNPAVFIGTADFVCPLVGMVAYHFDPALLLANNTVLMVNTQNNGNGNYGQIGVRNYELTGLSLDNPCAITNLQYDGPSGVNFTFDFDYTQCCPENAQDEIIEGTIIYP